MLQMISIYTTPNAAEAQQIASMLKAHGIEAFLPDDMVSNIAPHHLIATGGVAVQVAEENAKRARELIQQVQKDTED